MPPRFIYFDLGNVLVTFDHHVACRQVADLTGATIEQVHQLLFDDGVQHAYERGELTSDQFCRRLNDRFASAANDVELLHACSAMFQLNESMVPLVTALGHAGYPLGILSNTCVAHWEYVMDGRYEILNSYFGLHVLSFKVGAMKPESRIYEVAIEMAGRRPEDIFFMDDRTENVVAAVQSGLDAVLFRSIDELSVELAKRDVQVGQP